MRYQVPHYINGQEVFSKNQWQQDIFNPAIGQVIGVVNFASEKEINQAVDSASNAFFSMVCYYTP